jgi:hypothetical protein
MTQPNADQYTKIVVKQDFTTSRGITLKAGLEVEFVDFDRDLILVTYNQWGGDASIAALPAEFLEEVVYGVVERRPFVEPQ